MGGLAPRKPVELDQDREAIAEKDDASSQDLGDMEDHLVPPPPAPPRPARQAHASWKCPECGWDTGRRPHWVQRKAAHINRHHPDLKHRLSARQAARLQVLPWRLGFAWRCPVPECDKGLPQGDYSQDARLIARRRHYEQDHPDLPKEARRLKRPTESAKKATRAVLNAAAAARLMQVKQGKAGKHQVEVLKLPSTDADTKAGRRTQLTQVFCGKCGTSAATVAALGKLECRLVASRGPKIPQRLERLKASLSGDLEPHVRRDTERAIVLLQLRPPAGSDAHEVTAVAWPTDPPSVKFICETCGKVASLEASLGKQYNGGHWDGKRRGHLAELRQAEQHGGWRAKAARTAMGAMGAELSQQEGAGGPEQ